MGSFIKVDNASTSIFDHSDDTLNFNDIDKSFVILQKDVESIRASYPDEGMSECDYSAPETDTSAQPSSESGKAYSPLVVHRAFYNKCIRKTIFDQLSIFWSINCSNTENDSREILREKKQLRNERFEKIAMYQKEVLSALHELTRKLDSLKASADEPNNGIDSLVNSSDNSLNRVDTIAQTETMLDDDSEQESKVSRKSFDSIETSMTRTQCVSAEIESVALHGVEADTLSAVGTLCMSTEPEVRTTEIATESIKFQPPITLMPGSSASVEHLANAGLSLSEIEGKKSCILPDSSLTVQHLTERGKKERAFLDKSCEDLNKIMELLDRERIVKKILEKEVLLLRENCTELTRKLEAVKGENDALHMEMNEWSEERERLYESNKLLKCKLESKKEEYEMLKKEIDLLRTKSGTIQVDLDNTKAELAEARRTISELQTQNSDLQKTEISADVYNNLIEKQEIDILRFRATEKSYLYRIELLTDENKLLRNYFDRCLNRCKNIIVSKSNL
ncbi:hypothetical protein TSAR_010067 [Trichomalopsis sarcophagae]|uniref:Uncharacterized protein n=1 Tax=Trichomalopsis sarcophagae TaxID=543379 RepID=A0A232FJR5_9HYME|nr:hypothetical protein TSAR_010067 [Trichomalopsis sarcophagae]